MRYTWLAVLALLLLIFAPEAQGQGQLGACPALVEQALVALADNCGDLGRNTACYGYNRVGAEFTQPQPVGFFTLPADRADLTTLKTIRTAPLNLQTRDWGIAVMNVQANVPNSLTGQSVRFILLGEAALTNEVPPDEAALPGAVVNVTAQTIAELRAAPSLSSNVVGTALAGSVLAADGISPDSQWLRVFANGVQGWINRGVLAPSDEVTTLVVLSAEARSPMQAFYFTGGIGKPDCQEAPSTLAIQSPENLVVDLTVNGANIQVGSFVTLQSLPNNVLNLTVHRGKVETEDGAVVEPGQSMTALVDPEGNVVGWEDPQPATQDELLVGQISQIVAKTVESVNPIDGDEETTDIPEDDGLLYHIVQPGENLFRIALRYNTSVQEIAQANGITDIRRIFVGQRLLIPRPGSGFVNAPDAGLGGTTTTQSPVTDETDSQSQGVDCTGFRLTSPLGGIPLGSVTLYWDPAPGATSYQVNFYDQNGAQRLVLFTQGSETNLPFDSVKLGEGRNFSWDVVALVNGLPVCITARVSLLRDEFPNVTATPEPPPMVASWICSGVYQLRVSYDNVPAGNGVIIVFDVSPTDINGGTFAVPPNSQTFNFSGPRIVTNGYVTATPSGIVVPLPGTLSC